MDGMALLPAMLNMALALACGALIGSERQVRQRMAGLRTNALVALGASVFVVFSAQFPDEMTPSRVGAQVVSGIGFLGAGIIFRSGFNVHGVNTAATLWCSAAVGVLAGIGAAFHALAATGFVVFINLGLRPLVKLLKKRTRAGAPPLAEYQVVLKCAAEDEGKVRALILKTMTRDGVLVTGLDRERDGEGLLVLTIGLAVNQLSGVVIDQLMSPLLVDPRVGYADWDLSRDS